MTIVDTSINKLIWIYEFICNENVGKFISPQI